MQDSLRKHIIQHLSSTYGYLIARTAFIDYIFKNSLSENIPQIVILGAGSDTRAYRYQELLGKTRIFELDIAPKQKRKIEILNDEKIDIPEQVTLSASILELTNLKMF